MPAMSRSREVRNQYVTSDLDASRVLLLPFKNRHRWVLTAHPDNAAGEGVWVRLLDGTALPPAGKLVNTAGATLDVDDPSASVGGIDATSTNSGIFIPTGGNFTDDGSMQFIFDGGLTAIGSAAGQKLIVLEY